jgi:alcohol dehydrogenase class IV
MLSHHRGAPLVGPGAVSQLGPVTRRLLRTEAGTRCRRVVLVTGAGFDHREWAPRVLHSLRRLEVLTRRIGGPPTPEAVARLAALARDAGAGALVAVGGGAVLDAAKAAAVLAGAVPAGQRPSPAAVVAACADAVRSAGPDGTAPLVVAAPTTPGTGAEVTPWAAVWDVTGGRKLTLASPAARPAAAVLDPDLLLGLPRPALVGGALDALTQGSEAAWSVRSTPESISAGLTAAGLVGSVLDRAATGPADPAVRLALLLAGHLSGRAITAAPTTVCHALSYVLTLRHGLAHGHACGAVLGRTLRYNAAVTAADCADPRGAAHVHATLARIVAALNAPGPSAAAARVDRALTHAGLAALADIDLDPTAVAAEALTYPRAHDNPRRLDHPTLTALLTTPVARSSGSL